MTTLQQVLAHWRIAYCTDHIDCSGDSVRCLGHWVRMEETDDDS
jgi:hypothetical protein